MPEDKLPIPQFAAKIKAKYPEYKDVNDTLLVQKIVAKYPEYRESVDLSGIEEPPKKKVSSLLSGVISQTTNGLLNGGGGGGKVEYPDTLPETQEHLDFVKKHEKALNPFAGKVESASLADDPVKHILSPFRNQFKYDYGQAEQFATPNKQVGESTRQRTVGGDIELKKGYESESNLIRKRDEAKDNLESMASKVYSTLIPNGEKAIEYLQEQYTKRNGVLPDDNETMQLAVSKAKRYEDLTNRVNELPNLDNLSIELLREGNNHVNKTIEVLENRKYGEPSMVGAETRGELRKQENFYNEIVPPQMRGYYLEQLVNDPDIEAISKQNPEVKKQLDYYKNGGIYEKYPEYGEIVARNILSREYEKRKSNGVINPIFNKSKYLDNLADELFKNNPGLKKIANERLKGNWEGKLNTAGVVDEFAVGAKDAFHGMGETVKDLVGEGDSEADRLYSGLKQQYSQVESGVKGWRADLGHAANFAGMIAGMAAPGGVLKLGGLSPAARNFITTTATFGDQELNNWTSKYPGEPEKANIGAFLTTLGYGVVSKAFPSAKVADAVVGKFRPEITSALSTLESKGISQEVKNNIVNKFAKVLKETGKGMGEGSAHMMLITAFQDAFDQVAGLDPQEYSKIHHSGELIDVARNMSIGLAAPSFIKAYGARNRIGSSLSAIANSPVRHLDVLEKMKYEGHISEADYNKKVEDIIFLNKTKQELLDIGILERNQSRFLVEALDAKYVREKMSNTPDQTIKRKHEAELKRIEETQEKILNGEDVAGKEEEPTPDLGFYRETNEATSEAAGVSGSELSDNELSQKEKGSPLSGSALKDGKDFEVIGRPSLENKINSIGEAPDLEQIRKEDLAKQKNDYDERQALIEIINGLTEEEYQRDYYSDSQLREQYGLRPTKELTISQMSGEFKPTDYNALDAQKKHGEKILDAIGSIDNVTESLTEKNQLTPEKQNALSNQRKKLEKQLNDIGIELYSPKKNAPLEIGKVKVVESDKSGSDNVVEVVRLGLVDKKTGQVIKEAEVITGEAPPQYTEAAGVSGSALKDVPQFAAKSDKHFEYVPIEEVDAYKEFDRETDKKFDKKELDDLTEDIRVNGIKTPIQIKVDRNGKALIVEGNTRLAAAKRLGIKNIPVEIVEGEFGSINKEKAKKLPDVGRGELQRRQQTELGLKDNNGAYSKGFTKVVPKDQSLSPNIEPKGEAGLSMGDVPEVETHESVLKRAKTGTPIEIDALRIQKSDNVNNETGVFFADKGIIEEYQKREESGFYGEENKGLFAGDVHKYKLKFENPLVIRSQVEFIKKLAEMGDKEAREVLPNWQKEYPLFTNHETYADRDKFVAKKARELGYDGIVTPLEYIALGDKSFSKAPSISPNIEPKPQSTTEGGVVAEPKIDAEKSEKTTQDIDNQPPTPPEKPVGESGEGELNDKGILNRLYNAKGTPKDAKEGFKEKGLKYVPQGREEAAAVAKTVVDEFGVDEAVLLAEANKFKGGVNSAIFAESLNRLYEQELAAKTPQEKAEIAKKFAEVGIRYDEVSREKGRDISQIDFFYKKSPLGVEMMEKAKRAEAFEDWAKPKDKSWKEVFDEMMKNEEFEKEVNERVKEELKKERAETRKARKEKVDKFFDDAVEKTKGGATYGTIIPPPVIRAAIRGMQKAYHAGEKVVELVEEAVAYISDKLGTDSWDKDRFRKEWTEKLKDKQEKKPLTDAELKTKILDKFRKKLKGLSDAERDEVIRKSFKKIVESGGLDYKDFRDIIGEVTGRKSLTDAEAAKLRELVNITNSVKDAETRVLTERTEEALLDFRKAELQAGKAAKELSELLYNKPDIVKRLTSIMQLSTLGIPSLINNPIYNIWNQATLRFPIGVINDVIDRVVGGMAKITGKNYVREYNVFETQKEFWNKLGLGTKESMTQLFTGLNRQDYTQKELYGQQIRPFKSMRDLLEWSQGKKKLNQRQIWDKAIQATVGVPAEAVARVLNIGDKPMRFSAEGAQASAFAKALGLKGMDYKLFVEFPREEAYRAYKAQGLSDAEAAQKADYIKEAVVKEGQRSTFQQDNLLNEGLTRLFSIFGGKESGTATLTKALTISPYVKIPSNAFWSYYNLLNPEIAILQAMAHGGRAKHFSNKGEFTKSKLASREARYWMAHAIVGMASRAVVIALVKQGVFTPGSDEDDSKKERDAVSYFDKPGTTQVGGMKISNRWFGQWGMLGNAMAKKYRDATPEQREKQDDFWNTIFGGMEVEGLKEMQNGIFANSSALLQAIDSGNPDRYLTNTLNMMANIVQPAAIAQYNRASLDEVPSSRGDNLLDKLNQNFAQRSPLYRKLTGTQIDKKRDIWGQTIPRGGNVLSRMFGISKANPQIFARPIYDDYLKTGDSGFLPPAVLPVLDGQKLKTKQYEVLQEYIGAERKKLVEPYVNNMAIIPITNKRYSELDDSEKKEVLTFIYSLGRENGVNKFYKDFPELKPKDKPIDEVVDDRIMEATKKIIKIKSQ